MRLFVYVCMSICLSATVCVYVCARAYYLTVIITSIIGNNLIILMQPKDQFISAYLFSSYLFFYHFIYLVSVSH